MKYIILTFYMIVLTGCNTARPTANMAATGAPLVHADTSRINSIAIQAIATKYPDLKPGDLVFDSIKYSVKADGSKDVIATYNLPASAKQEETSKDGATIHITHTQNVAVTLSATGKVTSVSKGSGMIYSSTTK